MGFAVHISAKNWEAQKIKRGPRPCDWCGLSLRNNEKHIHAECLVYEKEWLQSLANKEPLPPTPQGWERPTFLKVK